MTDYYQHFCEGIQLTKEEAEWVRGELNEARRLIHAREETDEGEKDDIPDWLSDCSEGDEPRMPSISVDKENILIFECEESERFEAHANFAQLFLKRWRPHAYFTIEWANTSSRPVLGGFSGGCVIIDAKEQHWISPDVEIRLYAEKHGKKRINYT